VRRRYYPLYSFSSGYLPRHVVDLLVVNWNGQTFRGKAFSSPLLLSTVV
jgi:hypothetical protein